MAEDMKYWIERAVTDIPWQDSEPELKAWLVSNLPVKGRHEISLKDDTSSNGTIFSITKIAPGRFRVSADESENPFYRVNLSRDQAIEALQEAIQWLKK